MRKTSPKDGHRRIAVLVDTATNWGRGIIFGIRQYAHMFPNWRIFVEARGPNDRFEVPRDWNGDGIIARVGDEKRAAYIHSLELPVINVSALQFPGPEFPRVATDVEAVGRMAAKYFLDRGFRHFAYVSLNGLECVSRQNRAFSATVEAAGFKSQELGIEINRETLGPEWNLRIEKLSQWLKSLPKPVGILTWSGGGVIIDSCDEMGLNVPEEVALLSGSNDDLLCEISNIPISAIQQPVEQIGFQAATLLDRILLEKYKPKQPIWIEPLSVITRQSTNTLAISDRAVVAALNFIRENAQQPIRVSNVAAAAGVSRRVLERRFTEHLHRTPADYIRRAHLDCAKRLLAQTDQPISLIAEASGFPSQQYLTYMLRRDSGMSPLKYRRQARATFH